MSESQARLAVVGVGRMGRMHASNLASRVPSARLVAVVDGDARRAEDIGRQCCVRAFGSIEQAVDAEHVDGVVIATPPAAHTHLITAAARAGKHVLCEKPLGLDPAAARRTVDAAATWGVELRVGFQRRFDPGWVALRESLTSGRLGRLRLFRSSHRNAAEPPDRDSLGGLLVDLGVHDLDAARWLAGPALNVFARATPAGSSASVSLSFRGGALGLIDLDGSAAYGFECSAELVGSRATARVGGARPCSGLELLADGAVSSDLAVDHEERHRLAYVHELDSFGRLAVGREEGERGATGADAVAALELARLAGESLEQGHAIAVGEAP